MTPDHPAKTNDSGQMTAGEVELKSCPFCGGEAEQVTHAGYPVVYCAESTCAGSEAAASPEAWNRRTPPPEVVARHEAVEVKDRHEHTLYAAPGGGWFSTRWEFEEAWKEHKERGTPLSRRAPDPDRPADVEVELPVALQWLRERAVHERSRGAINVGDRLLEAAALILLQAAQLTEKSSEIDRLGENVDAMRRAAERLVDEKNAQLAAATARVNELATQAHHCLLGFDVKKVDITAAMNQLRVKADAASSWLNKEGGECP